MEDPKKKKKPQEGKEKKEKKEKKKHQLSFPFRRSTSAQQIHSNESSDSSIPRAVTLNNFQEFTKESSIKEPKFYQPQLSRVLSNDQPPTILIKLQYDSTYTSIELYEKTYDSLLTQGCRALKITPGNISIRKGEQHIISNSHVEQIKDNDELIFIQIGDRLDINPNEGGDLTTITLFYQNGMSFKGNQFDVIFHSIHFNFDICIQAQRLSPHLLSVFFPKHSLPSFATFYSSIEFSISLRIDKVLNSQSKSIFYTWTNYSIIYQAQSKLISLCPILFQKTSLPFPLKFEEFDTYNFKSIKNNLLEWKRMVQKEDFSIILEQLIILSSSKSINLLKEKFQMNTNCTSLETGNCPLHSSIIYGNSQLFQFFLSDFVFLNHTNFNGLTPNDLIMDNTYFNNIFKEWINEKDSEIINSLRISTTQNFCEVFEPIFPIEYPTINIIEPDNLPIISPKSTKDEYLLGGGIQFQRSRSLPTFDTSDSDDSFDQLSSYQDVKGKRRESLPLLDSNSVENSQNQLSFSHSNVSTTSTLAPLEVFLSHNIPHQLQTTKLLIPVSCSYCEKFIWGIYRQAIRCLECHKYWHTECESSIKRDCGFNQALIVGALTKAELKMETPSDFTTSIKRRVTLGSTQRHKLANTDSIGNVVDSIPHSFMLYSYKFPAWCKHCTGYIFGNKQGLRCTKCNLDCHPKCVNNLTKLCIESGQLTVVKGKKENEQIKEKVSSRRTQSPLKQASFNRENELKIHASFVNDNPSIPQERKNSSKKFFLSLLKANKQNTEDGTPLKSKQNKSNDRKILKDEPNISKSSLRLKREELEKEILTSNTFEDFEITNEHLGSGQFSIVKKGFHKKTHVPIAVKIIDKARFIEKPKTQRFLKREVEILMSLSHPGIIKLYGISDSSSKLHLFMELVEGGDLLAYVEGKGKLKEDEAKFLFHQLLVAVRYLHHSGIIHRDLKPENVLLTEEDGVRRLKIADFGFANIIPKKTLLNSVVGTPSYMAPEIISKKTKGYRESVDMWSIGVMLYACLGGVFPFEEDEPVEDQIKTGKFTFPDEYFELVSDEALDLCCNLLSVDPEDRPSVDTALRHVWFSTSEILDL